nr:LysM domain-containing protein [uncultured Chryseobacterium sp.]
MEYSKHHVKRGDTLESIAEKYKLTGKELLTFHNSHSPVTQQFFGDYLPIHMNVVIIPLQKNKEEKKNTDYKTFEHKNKYRTEQLNITRIEDDIKTYSQLKKEYEVRFNLSQHWAEVKLCDFFYEFNPPGLSRVFDFVSEVDYIRNDCLIEINELGRFSKIIDKNKLKINWEQFKKNKLNEIEFVKVIKETKPEEYEKLLKEGDFQFSDQYNDEKDYNRDLFYLAVLDKYLYNDDENLGKEDYIYQSQLFPDVQVPMKMRYDILKKEGDLITIRKVWETIESEELLEKVTQGYEKYHQPLIKYKFSEYKLDMRNLFTYNVKTKVLEKAELTIIENIENNIKSECIFNLKKLNNGG